MSGSYGEEYPNICVIPLKNRDWAIFTYSKYPGKSIFVNFYLGSSPGCLVLEYMQIYLTLIRIRVSIVYFTSFSYNKLKPLLRAWGQTHAEIRRWRARRGAGSRVSLARRSRHRRLAGTDQLTRVHRNEARGEVGGGGGGALLAGGDPRHFRRHGRHADWHARRGRPQRECRARATPGQPEPHTARARRPVRSPALCGAPSIASSRLPSQSFGLVRCFGLSCYECSELGSTGANNQQCGWVTAGSGFVDSGGTRANAGDIRIPGFCVAGATTSDGECEAVEQFCAINGAGFSGCHYR